MKVLMVDIGGTNVKVMASREGEMRKLPSGKKLTGPQMVAGILELTADWDYDCISIGFPSLMEFGRPVREPLNLGGGWLEMNYEQVFQKPVRFMNDASLQALGNYSEGRLLFLGFGTSTGIALIVDDVVVPMEVGGIRLSREKRFMDRLSKAALKRSGVKRWLIALKEAVVMMNDVFHPDVIVLGGGNSKNIELMPLENCIRADNRSAYLGALRLWEGEDALFASASASSWKIRRNSL